MSQPSVSRVAILGAESTGKSTLATALAVHYCTLWVPEYLREFVDTQQRTPQEHEQIFIAVTQLEREKAALAQARSYLFCDTTPMMTAIYSRFYFGRIDAQLQALAAQHSYDFTIVTAPNSPWMPDGLQRESDEVRQLIHAQLQDTLAERGIRYLLVEGSVEERVRQVTAYLP